MSKKILFFVAHPELDAGARYRVYQFRTHFEAAGYECVVAPFSSAELFAVLRKDGHVAAKVWGMLVGTLRRAAQILSSGGYDAVVINREVFPFFAPLWEKAVLKRNCNVIFNFDDAIYAGHPDTSSFRHPMLYRLKYGTGVDEVMRRCTRVIAGNRILAEYARKLNPEVCVIPTVVDCDYYRYRDPRSRTGNPVTIGWMGSASTAPYLTIVEEALKRVDATFPGQVQFRFFGAPDYELEVADNESLPFRLSSEITDLQSLDVGIMPMPDTEWTRGKCAFKAVQYMACGAATVASPVGITGDLIQHGENGFLANSSDQWFDLLARLVTERSLRVELARRARKTVETGYSLQTWGPVFVRAVAGAPSVQAVENSRLSALEHTARELQS